MNLSFPKMLKSKRFQYVLLVILALFALYLLYSYGVFKTYKMDTLDGSQEEQPEATVPTVAQQSDETAGYVKQETASASDLMPLANSDKFSNDLTVGLEQNVSSGMLSAGQMIGTVSQVNKNPNLQLRSEDANPLIETGPWNKSSIVPDTSRRSLEIQ